MKTLCTWLSLVCLLTAAGCSKSKQGEADAPAFDDGASAGQSVSALVSAKRGASMSLTTGAELKIPAGAVEEELEVTFKRPPDKDALALAGKLNDDDQKEKQKKAASAPYVVTPHGTKFKKDVEVALPILKMPSASAHIEVMWLEKEEDKQWKKLAVPSVEDNKAKFKIAHFSVLLLVEVPGPAPAVEDAGSVGNEPADAGVREPEEAAVISTAIMCKGSDTPCEELKTPSGITEPCCEAETQKCGLELTSLLPAGCYERDAPGVPSDYCNRYFDQEDGVSDNGYTASLSGSPLTVPGCCTPAGVCGIVLDSVFVNDTDIPVGVGCVPVTRLAAAGFADAGVVSGAGADAGSLTYFCTQQ
jgi:hypothetical protein